MTRKFVIAFCAFTSVSGAAVAGPIEDCNPQSPSPVIVRSCSEIIQGRSFSADQKAIAYKNRAIVHLNAGANDKAIADFTAAIRLKKGDGLAYAGRGWAKFTDKNVLGSIADYNEAIRLSPNNAALYMERGHVNYVANRLDDSIRDLSESLRLNPKSDEAFNTRGLAYAKLRDFARAQQDYSSAIEINPMVAIYYVNRGRAYEELNKQKEAVNDFMSALTYDPSLSEAMVALRRLQPAALANSQTDRLINQGKELAETKCSSCHAVGSSDISKKSNAPEFRKLSEYHQYLALRGPIERALAVTHEAMGQTFNLSHGEVEALVAYINSFVKR